MNVLCKVAAAIHGSTANLQAVQDAGGFERITQLLQWAALTFPKAPTDENGAALPQQQQLGSRSSQPVSPRVPHSPFPASPRMLAEDSIPTCSPRGLGESAVPASFPSTPARHHSGSASGKAAVECLPSWQVKLHSVGFSKTGG
jgi:hypothetical protein